jgi:hypothetical protein
MNLPLGISSLNVEEWSNAHSNFRHTFKKGASFDLTVSDPAFKAAYPTLKEQYNKTTANLQWLIRHAIDHKIRLRAMGSGWSFSKIAVTEGGVVKYQKAAAQGKAGCPARIAGVPRPGRRPYQSAAGPVRQHHYFHQ